jgi:hypothetical protein
MKWLAALAMLVAASVLVIVTPRPAVAQNCPVCVAQHEQCMVNPNRAPDVEYQNCLARNRQEDARVQQCMNERRQCFKEAQQERERQERERYCRQNPDAPVCR